MKTANYLSLFFLLVVGLLLNLNSFSQDKKTNCRVLLNSISGTYEGGCRNGFAHGKGIAHGIDSYEGRFKEGLPNGSGKYTWANGNIYKGEWKKGKRHGIGTLYSSSNGESIKGYWKEDEFIKEIEDPGYRVINQYNIENISFVKKGDDENKIVLKFMRDGKLHTDMDGLNIRVSSGLLNKSSSYVYRSIVLPWTCNIEFASFSKLTNLVYHCKVNYEITRKGSWEIIIKY